VAKVQRSVESIRNRWNKLSKLASVMEGSSSTVAAAEHIGSVSQLAEDNAQQSDVEGEEFSEELGEEAAAEVMVAHDEVTNAFPTSSTHVQRSHDFSQQAALQLSSSDQPSRDGTAQEESELRSARFAFQHSLDQDRAVHIFDASYHTGLPAAIVDVLVRHTWQLDESAHGGSRDQRSLDGRAMKTEAGIKSLCKGYAVQPGTRWLVVANVGLPTQKALTFNELFDIDIMVKHWQTGKEGRPPVPMPRKGHNLLTQVPELCEAFEKLAWIGVKAKRECNKNSAEEDELATEPVHVEITTGPESKESMLVDVRFLGAPGVTGVTWNVEPIEEGNVRKVEKVSYRPVHMARTHAFSSDAYMCACVRAHAHRWGLYAKSRG
jgi:hypothetical protein